MLCRRVLRPRSFKMKRFPDPLPGTSRNDAPERSVSRKRHSRWRNKDLLHANRYGAVLGEFQRLYYSGYTHTVNARFGEFAVMRRVARFYNIVLLDDRVNAYLADRY